MHRFVVCYSILVDGRWQHAVHCILSPKLIDASGRPEQHNKIDSELC